MDGGGKGWEGPVRDKESRLTRETQDVLDIERKVSCSGVVVESCELVEAGLESLDVGLELTTRAFLGVHSCGLVPKQVQEFEGVGEAEERVSGREHLLSFELDGEGAVGGCGRMRRVERVELVTDIERRSRRESVERIESSHE